MRINTNMAALNAWRSMSTNETNLQNSLERLSSGYRINRAADDAAGLAVSEKMTAQIRGLNMATRNAQDAVSLVQTAEGGMSKIQDMLQRMRELTVQASSQNLQDVDRAQLDTEFQALKAEIGRTTTATTFNGISLLSGGTKEATATGSYMTDLTVNTNTAAIGSTKVKINTVADSATVSVDLPGSFTAVDKDTDANSGYVFTLKYGAAKAGTATYTLEDGQTYKDDLVSAINADTATTKVTATWDNVNNKITLYNLDTNAADIIETRLDGSTDVQLFGTGTVALDAVAAGVPGKVTSADVTNASFKITQNTAVDSGYKLNFKLKTLGVTDASYTTAFTAAAGTTVTADAIVDAINNNSYLSARLTASLDGGHLVITDNGVGTDSGFTVAETFMDGDTAYTGTINYGLGHDQAHTGTTDLSYQIYDESTGDYGIAQTSSSSNDMIIATGVTATATTGGNVESTVTVTDNRQMSIQVGANNGETIDFSIGSTTNASLGITDLSIGTLASLSSGDVLNTLDDAIASVSSTRASVGAVQNRMDSAIDNLQTMAENLTAANSRIKDVDMAEEMANFTKYQVLSQASTAMLAQANQLSQGILTLLR